MVSCEGGKEIRRSRVRISLYLHSHDLCRVRIALYAHWHRISGDVWGRELGVSHVRARVHIDDGTLLQSCFLGVQTVLTGGLVYITADVDLACGRGNCMAERLDEAANIGAGDKHQ